MTEQQARKYRAIIEQGAQSLTDAEALAVKTLYPKWAAGQSYTVGYKLLYGGELYKVIQAHTSQASWTPDAAPAMFTRIDEQHDGSRYDPIPYTGNMELYAGMYYSQLGVTYRCTRATGAAVFQPLADLVGIYVEVVADD